MFRRVHGHLCVFARACVCACACVHVCVAAYVMKNHGHIFAMISACLCVHAFINALSRECVRALAFASLSLSHRHLLFLCAGSDDGASGCDPQNCTGKAVRRDETVFSLQHGLRQWNICSVSGSNSNGSSTLMRLSSG